MTGVRRARKFEIGEKGSKSYEKLINNPFVQIIKEDSFNNFTNHYIIVHYIDQMADIDGEEDKEDVASNSGDGGEEGNEHGDH